MKRRLLFIVAVLAAVMLAAFAVTACGKTSSDGTPGDTNSPDTPSDASVTLSGMKTEFEFGEAFSVGNLVVTVKRTDDSEYTLDASKYTVDSSAFNGNVAGEYTIVVKTNSGLTASYKATVSEAPPIVTDSELVLTDMKTEFEFGEAFSVGDLVVTVKRSDNTEYVAESTEYTVNSAAYNAEVAGEYTITVALKDGDVSKTYTVTVLPERVYRWDDDGALKILMIGNSFSDDTLEHAWHIAKSLGIENVYLGGLYIGGCTLDTHANNALNDASAYEYRRNSAGTWSNTVNYKMSAAIAETNWDFISLQQASGSSGVADTYTRLAYLINYVKEHMSADCHAEIVWNMTWAYQQNSTHNEFSKYNNNQTTMYDRIVNAVQTKVLPSGIKTVIPNGTAVQNARTSYVGDTLTRDGYHMSYGLGRYIAGLTLIHKLTGLPIDDIAFSPTGMDAADKPLAIEAVKNAVATPYAVTQSALTTDPGIPTIDETAYTPLDFELTQGFYNSTDVNQYANIIVEDSDFNRCFLATKRFTPSEIPVGSIIVLKRGWQYRPEHWVNSTGAQSGRADNETLTALTVTPEWWAGYTHRAFNVAKAGSSEQINNKIAEAKEAFKIYVPKTSESENILALGYKKLGISLAQGFYNSTDSNNPTGIITNNSTLTPQFFATARLTKTDIPVGSLIVVNEGWGYRPEAWLNDGKQASRPGESTIHITIVNELWWGSYTHRAFNVFKSPRVNISGQDEAAAAAFNIYVPENTVDPFADYYKPELDLTLGFYDSTLEANPTGVITDNGSLSNKFYATKRFTKAELPIGTLLVIEAGWQYRPDAWVDEGKQSSRPGNVTEHIVTITEEWWGNYTHRGFNISKLGMPVIDGLEAEAKIAFRIYIPKAA